MSASKHYERYSETMFNLGHGYPLFQADPYDLRETHPGDVGYLQRGKFIPRWNHWGESGPSDVVREAIPVPGPLHAGTFKEIRCDVETGSETSMGGAKIRAKYECASSTCAILCLKDCEMKSVDLTFDAEQQLRRHILQNIRSIMESCQINDYKRLIIVTGVSKTGDWDTVVISSENREIETSASVDVLELDLVKSSFVIKYKSTQSPHYRSGHAHVTNQPCDNSCKDTKNQTVFIRRLLVRKAIPRVGPLVLKAGAEPKDPDVGEDDSNCNSPAVPASSEVSSDSSAYELTDGESHYHDDSRISRAESGLFQYIFEKSDADYAMIHDRDITEWMLHGDRTASKILTSEDGNFAELSVEPRAADSPSHIAELRVETVQRGIPVRKSHSYPIISASASGLLTGRKSASSRADLFDLPSQPPNHYVSPITPDEDDFDYYISEKTVESKKFGDQTLLDALPPHKIRHLGTIGAGTPPLETRLEVDRHPSVWVLRSALVPLEATNSDCYVINAALAVGGSLGNVYKAQLASKGETSYVAVKVPRRRSDDIDADIRRRTLRESEIWKNLDHENIVAFKGIFVPEDHQADDVLCMISEWADFGSALQYLDDHPLESPSIVSGFIDGLVYLHSERVGHMDLKPDNVLVTRGPRALICDFGHAIEAFEGGLAATDIGCIAYMAPDIAYMAPEVARSLDWDSAAERRALCEKADVYSFGLTSYELLTRQKPFMGLRRQMMFYLLLRSSDELEQYRPKQDTAISEALYRLFQSCWSFSPAVRPSMREVKKIYDSVRNSGD